VKENNGQPIEIEIKNIFESRVEVEYQGNLGILQITDLDWDFTKKADELFNKGDKVKAFFVGIIPGSSKYKFKVTLKDTKLDPWQIGNLPKVGDIVTDFKIAHSTAARDYVITPEHLMIYVQKNKEASSTKVKIIELNSIKEKIFGEYLKD